MRIVSMYTRPAIPLRGFAWSAIDEDTYDGAEDSSTRYVIGWGDTEEAAVNDLMEKLNVDGG